MSIERAPAPAHSAGPPPPARACCERRGVLLTNHVLSYSVHALCVVTYAHARYAHHARMCVSAVWTHARSLTNTAQVQRPPLFATRMARRRLSVLDVKALDLNVVEYLVEVGLAQLLAQLVHELRRAGGPGERAGRVSGRANGCLGDERVGR